MLTSLACLPVDGRRRPPTPPACRRASWSSSPAANRRRVGYVRTVHACPGLACGTCGALLPQHDPLSSTQPDMQLTGLECSRDLPPCRSVCSGLPECAAVNRRQAAPPAQQAVSAPGGTLPAARPPSPIRGAGDRRRAKLAAMINPAGATPLSPVSHAASLPPSFSAPVRGHIRPTAQLAPPAPSARGMVCRAQCYTAAFSAHGPPSLGPSTVYMPLLELRAPSHRRYPALSAPH